MITDETATIGNATPRASGVAGEDVVCLSQETPRWLLSHPVDFTHEYPSIAIVTTAALPWLTGTAVNPALRAAYLWERGHDVTLLVPWVVASDQEKIFLNAEDRFRSEAEQLVAVKRHIRKRVPFEVRWGDEHGDEDGDGDVNVNETDACDGEEHREAGGHRLRLVFYAGTCLERIIPRDCLVHWVHSSWYQNISALALTLRARSTGLGCIRKVLAGAGVHHSHPGYSAAGAEVGGMHRLGGTRASHVVSLGTAMDPSV